MKLQIRQLQKRDYKSDRKPAFTGTAIGRSSAILNSDEKN